MNPAATAIASANVDFPVPLSPTRKVTPGSRASPRGDRPGSIDVGVHEVGFTDEGSHIRVDRVCVDVARAADLGDVPVAQHRDLVGRAARTDRLRRG